MSKRLSIPAARTTAWVGGCSTGKRGYFTRKDAKRADTTRNKMTQFECEKCGYWHLGHLPAAVVKGNATRAEIRR